MNAIFLPSSHTHASLDRVWENSCAASGRGIVVSMLSLTYDVNTPLFLTSWPSWQPTDMQTTKSWLKKKKKDLY